MRPENARYLYSKTGNDGQHAMNENAGKAAHREAQRMLEAFASVGAARFE